MTDKITVGILALAALLTLLPAEPPLAESEERKPAREEVPRVSSDFADESRPLAVEGFLWSVSPAPPSPGAREPGARHVETDGYAWSTATRSTRSRPAPEAGR